MIDRVIERGESDGVAWVTCLKNVTANEPWCAGHFPGRPIMTGVLQLEAMAQAGVFLLSDAIPEGKLAFLTGVENARFKKPVTPGDQLRITARLEYFRRNLGKTNCEITVDGVVVSRADILFAVG